MKISIFKSILLAVLVFWLGVGFVFGADSRDSLVTATYCDGSIVDVYPYSFVTNRDDASTYECYEVQVTPITGGFRYGFEDRDDYDYNDLIVDVWVTGNLTASPTVHVRYVDKTAYFKHWAYIDIGGDRQLVFKAELAAKGTVYDFPLPSKACGDFTINASPPLRKVWQGEDTFYTVVVTAQDGFDKGVDLSVAGLPAGVTGVFDPNPKVPTGESKLMLTVDDAAPVGLYTLTVTGVGGSRTHSVDVSLQIKDKNAQKDYSMEVAPVSRTVYPGDAAEYTVTLKPINHFGYPVKLEVEGLPGGASAQFQPDTVTPLGETVLTVTTDETTPLGDYTLKVTGKGGGKTHSIEAALKLEERPPDPDFQLQVGPSTRSVYRGDSTGYTVTVTGINDFTEAVSLGVTGAPAGVSVSFGEDSITEGNETALQVEIGADTALGTYTLTVTGAGGGKEHSVTVSLEVKCRDFGVSIKADKAKGSAPVAVQFTSKIRGGEAEGTYTYQWAFGDGETSDKAAPSHTYEKPGHFTAALTVTDECGNSKQASKFIEVEAFTGDIVKAFTLSEAIPGQEVAFTVTVNNTSRVAFENVVIRDRLSPHLTYMDDDSGVAVKQLGQKLEWLLPRVEKKTAHTFRVRVKVSESAPAGVITNVAEFIHGSLARPAPSNTAVLTVQKVELLLRKHVDRVKAQPGDVLTYQLLLENKSSVTLTGIQLVDELSSHLEYVSGTGDTPGGAFNFSRAGSLLKWKGSLEAGKQVQLEIRARIRGNVFAGTRIPNRAVLEAAELREDIRSNTVETAVESDPIPESRIRFTKRSEVPQTDVGRVIRFSVTVANLSTTVLVSPVIDDHLPQGFTYVAGTALLNNQRFTEPPGKRRLQWKLPDIKGGHTMTIRYQVVIGADARRGKNVTRALLNAFDGSGKQHQMEASAFVNVSVGGFVFYSGVEGTVYLDRDRDDFFSMTDTPLEGIEVCLSNGMKTLTDQNGFYKIENLYAGEYAVSINRASLPEKFKTASTISKLVTLADGLTDTADLAVKLARDEEVKTARLEGFVYYDKNRNRVFDGDDPAALVFKARLDGKNRFRGNEGKFVFPHLEPGTHTVEILYGGRSISREVTLEPGNNKIEFPLPFTGIKIRVRSEK